MATTPRVLVIGDVMTDISARLSGPVAIGSDRRAKIIVRPGGSAATQAIWLASCGVAVDFVGKVGAADWERESERFRAAGVTPHLAADPRLETGRLIALVDPSGERSFLTDRGANDALSEADLPLDVVDAADHVHISGYSLLHPSPRAAVSAILARRAGARISVDPGSSEFLREIGVGNFLTWTAGCEILFPNADEAAVLGGDDPAGQRKTLAELYPLVVVKRGAAGAEAWEGRRDWRAAAPLVNVIDTTGAGDAFTAAFLAARLRGEDMQACLERGVAAGSAATGFLGARP